MNKLLSKILICLTILTTTLASGQESYEKKIQQLESGLSNLQRQINQLKNDLGDNISDTTSQRITNLEAYAIELNGVLTEVQEKVDENTSEVARVSKIQQDKPNIGIYGTVTAGKSSNQNSVIDAQSFELVLSGQPHKRISYFTELEFERAATVGGPRGGEVLIEQAYTDIKLNSWANFRGGVLLVPFGNIERDHFSPLREVISKPLTSFAIAPSDWTDNGFGFNGRFNLFDSWIADYQTYLIAGLDNNISTTGLRQSRQGFGVDNNNNKAFVGKVSLQNSKGFNLGVSYYNGAWDSTGSKDISGYNIDFDYKINWFEVVGEYTNMNIERENSTGTANMDGYYLRGIFALNGLLPENFLGADFPHARLSFVSQYDQVNIENFFDIGIADNFEKRMTLGLRLQVTPSWILNINHENASANGLERINRGDDNLWIFSLGYVF
jgi:outer membrane murein-binding lipoprotein Lpp